MQLANCDSDSWFRHRFIIVPPTLFIIIWLGWGLRQVLPIDGRDIPVGQVTESGIQFAGDGSAEGMEFRLGAWSFRSVRSPDEGDRNGMTNVVSNELTGDRCRYPSTNHSSGLFRFPVGLLNPIQVMNRSETEDKC